MFLNHLLLDFLSFLTKVYRPNLKFNPPKVNFHDYFLISRIWFVFFFILVCYFIMLCFLLLSLQLFYMHILYSLLDFAVEFLLECSTSGTFLISNIIQLGKLFQVLKAMCLGLCASSIWKVDHISYGPKFTLKFYSGPIEHIYGT